MTPEEVLREAREIDKELKHDEPKSKRHIWLFVGLFLVCIMVFYLFPYQWIKSNPEPRPIINVGKALAPGIATDLAEPQKVLSEDNIKSLVNPSDQKIKLTANKIVTTSCQGSSICYSKALYYFLRDNYDYVPDPQGVEYVEDPKEFLVAGGGDCESGSLTLAALQEAIGVDAQLVLISNHAYTRIKLQEAPSTYKVDDWIYMDWTCKECDFGEIPWKNWKKRASYVEVP
jgi:hypothetical protein